MLANDCGTGTRELKEKFLSGEGLVMMTMTMVKTMMVMMMRVIERQGGGVEDGVEWRSGRERWTS